ncbi:MAG TPA: tail fiber domain-containing protein [Pyrinomonadaceae bacterium]|nr:tail fiber domain-containing protein [Pyrinomonadaceae bacterium]
MSTARHTFALLAIITLLAASALAQNTEAPAQERAANKSTVTASASATGVRFVSPGETKRIRVEVLSATGERVFDSDFRAGGIVEWDAQSAADGAYLCIVTAEDLAGKSSRKFTALSKREGRVVLGREGDEQLKVELAQAFAAASQSQGGGELAAAAKATSKGQAVTVTTHDGQDGQVTSTTGALTFRTGNVFAGKDKEQMRVTADGRVGIGTDAPEATLDVAGEIRARGGIRFEDGTILNSANALLRQQGTSVSTSQPNTLSGTPTANLAGSGTTGRLPKWTDGATGTLGDSALIESAGKVGIGTASPATTLDIVGSLTLRNTSSSGGFRIADRASAPGQQMVFAAAPNAAASVFNTFVSGSTLAAPKTAQFSAWTSDIDLNPNNATQFTFAHTPTQGGIIATVKYGAAVAGKISFQPNWNGATPTALVVDTNSNVGVGTASPVEKLEVAGNMKLTGAGNGVIFPDGTKQTSAAASIGGANIWTGANVFNTGLSANNALITNVGNPVNAGDAVNKAYTDANFVKFVPGAEQLSVGDANGTATMINLRGGSTCCSGPGGHTPAFFKVFQNGSFVATGNLGIGTSPMEGKGYRTSWHTYKGAFRSGYADNEWDDANVGFFSWAGGSNSTASGLYALAFGDTNQAESTSSIVFGSGNQVKGAAGFSAGAGNRVCDTYGVALGNNARSGGPYINGKCDPETFNIRGLAAVAIGYNVTADQDHTTAMGKFASNNGFQGTFIWSDGAAQASADTFRNTANNEFAARATGGFRFRTNLGGTTGCNLPAGSGVFNCTSSRTTKENFLSVDGENVLTSLRKVPVSTWNYTAEGATARHMGPMAEDFYAAFGLGTSDKAIGVQDAVGVSLAAVKALDARTAELQQKTMEVEQLRTRVGELERRLAALEEAITKAAPKTGDDERR